MANLDSSFLQEDPEYPDLISGRLAVEKYLRLIDSANYWLETCPADLDDSPKRTLSLSRMNLEKIVSFLPRNLNLIATKITPAIAIKILGALEICPAPTTFHIYPYQLFCEVKLLGFKYNYKNKTWEYQTKWKN